MAPVAALPRDAFGRDDSVPPPSDEDGGEGAERSRGRVIAAVALVVAVVAAVVIVGAFALGGSDDDAQPAAGPSAPAADGGGGPAVDAPSGPPEEVLQAVINPEVLTGCNRAPNIDSQWADAQLTCTGPQGVTVDAYHFASQSSVDRQVGALAAYIVDAGECDAGQPSIEDWSTPAEPTGGARLCYFYADNFVMYWFYEADRVAFSVEHPDPAQLVTWWRNTDPVRH